MGSDRGQIVTDKLLGLAADEGTVFLENKAAAGIIADIVNSRTVCQKTLTDFILRHFAGYTGGGPRISTAATDTTDGNAKVLWSRAVPLSGTVGVLAVVIGRRNGAVADSAVGVRWNAVANNAGSSALVGSTGGSTIENSAGTPVIDIVANDTTDSVEVQVTGIASQTWSWVGFIVNVQVVTAV